MTLLGFVTYFVYLHHSSITFYLTLLTRPSISLNFTFIFSLHMKESYDWSLDEKLKNNKKNHYSTFPHFKNKQTHWIKLKNFWSFHSTQSQTEMSRWEICSSAASTKTEVISESFSIFSLFRHVYFYGGKILTIHYLIVRETQHNLWTHLPLEGALFC